MTLTIDQLNAIRPLVGLESPLWFPDGRRIAFLSGLAGAGEMWSVPAEGGFPQRLTVGMGSVRFLSSPTPRLSPDGRWLAYIAEKNGSDAEIYLWAPADGSTRQLTRHGAHINSFSWASDSGAIVFAGNRHGAFDIHRVEVSDGRTTRLTRSSRNEVYPVFTPDGQHIVYVRLDERWTDHEVVVIPAQGGEERVVARDEDFFDYHYGKTFGYPLIAPDGQTLVFRSHRSGWINYWSVPLAGGEPTPLCAEEADQSEAVVSPDGRHIAFVSNHNGTLRLDVVGIDGKGRRTLVDPELGACALPAWSPDGQTIAYLYQTPTAPLDLWTVDVASGGRRQLTQSLPGGHIAERLIQPEKVHYTTFDGQSIAAYLYKPSTTATGQRHPGLLITHGGPASQFTDTFNGMAQFFASQGYVVLMPNVRGSTGYGKAFETANYQDYGGGDLKDCVAAVEYLKTLDYVAPDKMAITGASYGGYLSMAAVCFAPPGVFQASIAASGYADRVSMYRMQIDGGDEQERRHKQQLTYRLGDRPKTKPSSAASRHCTTSRTRQHQCLSSTGWAVALIRPRRSSSSRRWRKSTRRSSTRPTPTNTTTSSPGQYTPNVAG
ncbi:MAG: S9 family peptidase [Anaerolineae bacterium]|nr:S9 family peptidase [Anaerolineae bacterium]